ncbi:MAG: hypothetical protein REI64_09150 [Pedobacter sp.]|uniref:hypothetical protein n=1 Tax=Pedobacter sp. TaxID=1411316 RepID=UPI002808BB86|nr:hypothetical protein [Pedobacter sp.]MDQ8004952.1 hypothetical protein [Pedobacter sp.]
MQEKNLTYLRLFVVLLPLLLFLISLTQVAFTNEGTDEIAVNQSYLVLLGGPFIILGGATFEWLTWMANPLALCAIILFLTTTRAKKLSSPTFIPNDWIFILSIGATVTAWQFSLWKEVMKSESGSMGDILSLNAGYWLWAISILLLALGIIVYFIFLRKFLANKAKTLKD